MYARRERKKVSIYSNALCRGKARKRFSLRSRLPRTPTSAVYRISVYARRRDARAGTKVRRRRGRKRKTRTAIVVEDLCHNPKTRHSLFFSFFFLLLYEALRKYFVIYERITTKRRPPPINIIFFILPAYFEILREFLPR